MLVKKGRDDECDGGDAESEETKLVGRDENVWVRFACGAVGAVKKFYR